ncbi:MAG: U32 family peptidase [Actinobacteria bacterium]|nr:U32 family peptidase [Actinomycetota bacterium]
MVSNKIPELMVPANNLKILKYAINYGADAVYVGGKKFNLRSIRGNFSLDELVEGVKYAHNKGVKVYFTLNSCIHENETDDLRDYIKDLKSIDLDGIIVADLGAIELIREIIPEARIHISTQASITNHHGVKIAEKLGASRVNLAREISFDDLKVIKNKSEVEIEVFVHGALCISYSGRCMLSKYMAGRDANKGECAHSCRWNYFLMEEQRSNLFFQIQQDKSGTYIYNSRDLCLLPELNKLIGAGIDSIKIEGRMKTESYVSLVTWVYRMALDYIAEGSFTGDKIDYLIHELDKASHRNFTKGFMFSAGNNELIDNENVGYIKKYTFVGTVVGGREEYGGTVIGVRNQFNKGSILDILQPRRKPQEYRVDKIIMASNGEEADVANPNDIVVIPGIVCLDPYSILRIKK